MQRISDLTEINGTPWYYYRGYENAMKDDFKDSDTYVSCLAVD